MPEPDPAIVDALVGGTCIDPYAVLGPHEIAGSTRLVLRVLRPGATAIDVLPPPTAAGDTSPVPLTRIHPGGLYAGFIDPALQTRYRLRVRYPTAEHELEDPYRFASLISPEDLYLFHEGRQETAWRFLGANQRQVDGVSGVLFAVWAPNARRVAVVGDFNDWDDRVHAMRLHHESGVWELFLPDVAAGTHYKFALQAADGARLPLKADPYATRMEVRPGTASRIAAPSEYPWQDNAWMSTRRARHHPEAPISIYEVHAGSWRRHEDSQAWLTYRELASQLVPYACEAGFTHIQLLPLHEHPFDGSWGYQPIGLFAPTSRFGDPDDLRFLVDEAHRHGLGVLLDWVPGHFPTDEHGIGRFDGTHLYEHSDPRQGFHPDWKTCIFNYRRPEVVSYLLSNAIYWLREFHIDGLRFDAVASMLYLDYSRADGEWIPNERGGRENLAAIELLQLVNTRCYAAFPDILMVAEESTAWPGVTQFADSGGLGFGFKWNMGWMNDTLRYMRRDPVHRHFHHTDMTFGLLYAFSEHFVLPLSHDEVVHGKGSLLRKMPGDDWQRFANLRAYLGFMWGHPGKKLLFMGGEFAQEREWSHDRSLDWHLLDLPKHRGMQQLVHDLNRVYHETPALWAADSRTEGFDWISAGDPHGNLFAFMRRDPAAPVAACIIVANLEPTVREGFRLGVPGPGRYLECCNTDDTRYGGSGCVNPAPLSAEAIPSHGRPWSVALTVPPLGTLFLRYAPDESEGNSLC